MTTLSGQCPSLKLARAGVMGHLGATLGTSPPRIGSSKRSEGALPPGGSAVGAVAEVHDTVEPVFLEQLQLEAGVARKCGLASTGEHRIDEEVTLIDQPRVERMCREGRPAHREVAGGGAFMSRTESGSKRCSSRVLAVDTACNVVAKTILSAAWSKRT